MARLVSAGLLALSRRKQVNRSRRWPETSMIEAVTGEAFDTRGLVPVMNSARLGTPSRSGSAVSPAIEGLPAAAAQWSDFHESYTVPRGYATHPDLTMPHGPLMTARM